uniref:Actin-like ATPase domain-containing protein n=1 Tax=Bionectria ochroleuca TaxID=29856 RepID=A0A8H7N276_BIOOC
MFKLSDDNRVELVGPADNVPDKSAVQNAKLEILLSDKGWFQKTEDYDEIKSWVEGVGKEPAVLATPPSTSEESITTVVTFPSLRDKFKELLKIGIMYSNIASRCQGLYVGLESHAALSGLLHTYPQVSREALAERESIIVADCGGITLDMTAFREFNPRCEGIPASSGSTSVLGGGLWIDRNFEKLVDAKLDELKAQINHPNDRQVRLTKSNLMAQWHRSIKGEPLVAMGGAYSFVLHGMQGSINRTDMERVLVPECQKIADAIFEVAKKERSENGGRPANRVCLTGGLGCSQAVRELVQRILDTKVAANHPALRIERTDTHTLWNAVALGAAHHFDPTIPVDRFSWQPFFGTPESDEMMG